jgi:hypothetical protein
LEGIRGKFEQNAFFAGATNALPLVLKPSTQEIRDACRSKQYYAKEECNVGQLHGRFFIRMLNELDIHGENTGIETSLLVNELPIVNSINWDLSYCYYTSFFN